MSEACLARKNPPDLPLLERINPLSRKLCNILDINSRGILRAFEIAPADTTVPVF